MPRHRRRRRHRAISNAIVRNAVHALHCSLTGLGQELPPWREKTDPSMHSLVGGFVEFRIRDRGVAPSTSIRDARVATMYLDWLRSRNRPVHVMCVTDIDDFVTACAQRWAPCTVADVCSSLRGFLRYLHATGRLPRDLSGSMLGPRLRNDARPRPALSFQQVRRILRAIDRTTPVGRRDYAMLLMMASYGMGASEAIGLCLDDIDWIACTVRVHRPKTGSETILPLLEPVAQAISEYLRDGRPRHSLVRNVFVKHGMPHTPFVSSGAVRHRIIAYAAIAGVEADYLGAHVFRHTHATRQIEIGVAPKIIGDILGHRRPESTTTYVRGAILKLRGVALPVPR